MVSTPHGDFEQSPAQLLQNCFKRSLFYQAMVFKLLCSLIFQTVTLGILRCLPNQLSGSVYMQVSALSIICQLTYFVSRKTCDAQNGSCLVPKRNM